MIIDISLLRELFFVTFPRKLYINRAPFVLKEASSNCLRFAGPDLDSIVVVSFSAHGEEAVCFPRDILVRGRRYIKRCENFYTPADATPEEVERFFDHIASEYEQTIDLKLNRIVARRMLAAARKFAGRHLLKGSRVLDFGCGTGLTWEELQKTEKRNGRHPAPIVYGCDLSKEMVERCKIKGFSNVSKCEYAETAFPDHYFDVIFCSFVVHYFVDGRPFEEMLRILRPGGLVIFNLPRQSNELKSYYESVLQNGLGRSTTLSVTHWTVETSKTRILPIIRYKSVRGRNEGKAQPLQQLASHCETLFDNARRPGGDRANQQDYEKSEATIF
jgi:ubiquinone/menaquinone biosynthesis C-methylase UbiE